jgi:hypothetical protein
MAMRQEKDILYEVGSFWVATERTGYAVYENGLTHSVKRDTIGYPGLKGLQRAKATADRRARAKGETS